MTTAKIIIIKKSFVVAAALTVGLWLPYLSRIPLAFTYGTAWIWKYISNSDDFIRWNGFHLLSLIPLSLFGFLYVYENLKWSFRAAAFGHFAVTFLIYYKFGEPRFGIDDFLGCLLFPPIIAAASFFGGIIGLIAELFINRRKVSAECA